MAYYCWKCRNELDFIVKVGVKVGRGDICKHCAADLHVCKNCYLHDPTVHNECRETQTEFIRDRQAGNFCAQFAFRDDDDAPEADNSAAKARNKLDDLFKNLK